MSIRQRRITRKQRFDAALKLEGLTLRGWSDGRWETSYLYRVLTGEYDGSPKLNALIDDLIERHFPGATKSPSAA